MSLFTLDNESSVASSPAPKGKRKAARNLVDAPVINHFYIFVITIVA